jgi:hypothetical protein
MQSQIAVHRSGLNAFASVGRAGFGSDSPSSTGGGSVGYNEMLQNDQWLRKEGGACPAPFAFLHRTVASNEIDRIKDVPCRIKSISSFRSG